MTATATTAAAAPALTLKDGAVYRGKITDQRLVFGRDEVPQIELTIPLDGELINPRKPEAGVIGAPQVTADVVLSLNPNDPTKMEYAVQDLERLGFTGEDLEALHPGHKNHISFVGKVVYVAPRRKVYNDRESVYWNLRFPRTFTNAAMGKGDLKKSGAADAYKEIMARRREASAAGL